MSAEEAAAAEAARRRRAARLLGDLTPESTSDDVAGPDELDSRLTRDDELRRDVPPHHGD